MARPPAPNLTRITINAPSTHPSFLPERIVQQINLSNQELTEMLSDLRQQVGALRAQTTLAQREMANAREGIEDLQGVLPPEAFDPQQARPLSRGTAKETLKNLERVTVERKSSILTQATLCISNGGPQFQAILGEFGPPPPHSFNDKSVVVASPTTGKGGLNCESMAKSNGSFVYMERGDGLTFVQKAIMAQGVGAVAVIIGNNTNASWPYVMKDSNGEANSLSLGIPAAMIKQEDGKLLVRHLKADPSSTCSLEIQSTSKECIICCETFDLGQTVLQLPACGHFFHETCALTWLTQHNACPHCRRELPTDDAAYEAERRRTQRTHAGSSGNTTNANGDSFYG
jgi:hypothetical protein